MPVGLWCAFATMLSYGVGSVLQAAAAASSEPVSGMDPRLLLALARSWRYPVGLALDGAGFVLSLIALRSLPLYVVQAVSAGFLAVVAVLGSVTLDLRLRRREVGALLFAVLGLVVLGLSAAPQQADTVSEPLAWILLGTAAVLAAVAPSLARLHGSAGASGLGALGGLAFGVVAVAGRAVTGGLTASVGTDVHLLLRSPATYAVIVAAPVALTAYATALQRGTVVQATAPLVVGETVLPALAGLMLLGDHTRAGWGGLAALGFVVAIGAALLLARFGEVPTRTGSVTPDR
jgi:hypothetical protein